MATQLTMEEREIISQMNYAGQSQAAIGRRLGRPASTVSRELKRNGSAEGYSAVGAQRQAQERRLVRKMDRPEVNEEVRHGLAQCWSPDQVAGRVRRDHPNDPSRCLSHQTVYDWLKRDANREHWEGFLRRGGKSRPKHDRRGKLKGTVSVADRPKVVDERRRFGDWEGDRMVGAKHRGALVTHIERRRDRTNGRRRTA